jgi:CheY-like chemotaxis protein
MSTPPCILLVDDEPLAVHTMARFLERTGFRIVTAADGIEALEQCRRENPAALVTDLRMPRGGGLELIAAARRDWPAMPVIAMTGFGTDEAERAARQAGADAVLRKPVAIGELALLLKNLTTRVPT